MEGKIIMFHPNYREYQKMWLNERWKFSERLVNLKIKQNKGTLNKDEEWTLNTLNQIVEANNGDWLKGYR